jgi:hypothetical protein
VTAATVAPQPEPEADPAGPTGMPGRPRRLKWWREVIYIAIFYVGYSVIRDVRGNRPVSIFQAFTNAERIIDLEQYVGIFQEHRIQSWFLGSHWFIRTMDDFYGTAHFAVTVGALLYLFFRQPWRYPRWRNTLAWTTALALIGFAFFPLMPPRLLPQHYHFVDTLKTVGGLWSFESGPVSAVSNQYAAMPSLHFAWSTWCALAIAPAIKRRWLKPLVFLYPLLTLICIVVTGNHYILDAVGGAVCLALGYGLTVAFGRFSHSRDGRPEETRQPEGRQPDGRARHRSGVALKGA